SASADGNRVTLVNRLTGLSGSSAVTDVEVDGVTFVDYEELVDELGSVLFKQSGTGSDVVQAVSAGTGISVDNTDPSNPVISADVDWGDVGDKPAVIAAGVDAAAARAAIGAGTSNLALGTTGSTAAAGDHTHTAATTSAAGFMSASDKTKLDGIDAGANLGVVSEQEESVGTVITNIIMLTQA